MGKKNNKYQNSTIDVVLTATERNLLRGKGSELLKMYLLINELRDFSNNIAGLITRISDSYFKEQMEIGGTGVKKWRPTTTHIQRWIKQLEKIGLIEHRGNYIFYCPLAFQKKTETKISHQAVTNDVTTGITKSDNDKTPINIASAGDLKDEVSPEVSPQVSQRLYTPPTTTDITNTTLLRAREIENFGAFKSLLNEYGFRPEQILSVKTIGMIKAWIAEGVTLEEARIATEAVNARRGVPAHPSYYLKPVMQVKSDFNKARSEAANVQPKSTPANQQRHKSPTQSFFDDTTSAIEQHYRNR